MTPCHWLQSLGCLGARSAPSPLNAARGRFRLRAALPAQRGLPVDKSPQPADQVRSRCKLRGWPFEVAGDTGAPTDQLANAGGISLKPRP